MDDAKFQVVQRELLKTDRWVKKVGFRSEQRCDMFLAGFGRAVQDGLRQDPQRLPLVSGDFRIPA